MSASVDELANKLVNGGRAITRASRVGVEEACLAGKEVLLASAASAGLTPGEQMSGTAGTTRRSKSRFNVRYRVWGVQNPFGLIWMTGPVHLVNNPTSPHWIAARHSAFGRSGRGGFNLTGASALQFPSLDVRWGPVWHPGTAGKDFFGRAEPVILQQSKRIIERSVTSHLARVF